MHLILPLAVELLTLLAARKRRSGFLCNCTWQVHHPPVEDHTLRLFEQHKLP